jgi:hypothetical protein
MQKQKKEEVIEKRGWKKIAGWILIILAILGVIFSFLLQYSCLGDCPLYPSIISFVISLILLISGLLIKSNK